MENLMTTKEAADYLKLHYVTIYKLAQQGRIPATKIGGNWRFRRDLLDEWLAKQAVAVEGSTLIVDDDHGLLEMLTEVISHKGFKVVAVDSGEQALEELEKQHFDLVFLDLVLPGINGVQVINAIKGKDKGTKIVIVTGYVDDPIATEAMSLEPWSLIKKPFKVNEIIDVLDTIDLHITTEHAMEEQLIVSKFLDKSHIKMPPADREPALERSPSEAAVADRSEPRFREMLDMLPETVFEADTQGNIIYANRTGLTTFGYTHEDLQAGVNVLQIVTPEDRQRAINNMQRITSGEDLGVNEYMVQRKDGSRFQIIMHVSRVTDDEGNYAGFRGVVVNITKPDQLEEMLWESEEKLDIIFECIKDAIVVTDLTGHIVEANEAAVQMGRFSSKDELIGRSAIEFVASKDQQMAIDSLTSRVGDGTTRERVEYTGLTSDGQEIEVDATVSLLRDGFGNPTGLIAVLRDMTARKRAEEALRKSEQKYRELFDEAPVAVTIVDTTGMVIDCNEATERLAGYSKHDLVGKRFEDLLTLGPKDLPILIENFENLMKGQGFAPYELEIIRKDGGRRWVLIRDSLIKKDGKIVNLQINAVDITDRKLVEEALIQSEEKYRGLFNGSIDGMVVIDAETMRVVLANEAAFQMYGFDPGEDISDVDLIEYVHPDDRERALKSLGEDMFEKDLRRMVEFRTLTKDGEVRWVSGMGTRIVFQGKPAGLVSFRDITDQKMKGS